MSPATTRSARPALLKSWWSGTLYRVAVFFSTLSCSLVRTRGPGSDRAAG